MKENLIGILGAGKSGVACSKLALKFGYKVILSDIFPNKKIDLAKHKNLIIETGKHSKKLLNCDFIIISPGISPNIKVVQNAIAKNIPIIGEIEFASWFSNADVLAITGSNGKSTTCMMLHNILLDAGYNSLLGGNIGIAFSDNVLKEIDLSLEACVHVVELSSFQIETLKKFKSKISCVLNISEDHLDRYGSMNDYVRSKLKIIDFSDIVIYDSNDTILKEKMRNLPHSKEVNSSNSLYRISNNYIYSEKELMFSLDEINFIGSHNLLNALNACTIAGLYGVQKKNIVKSMKKIKALPHRLEFVDKIRSIKFYNDSKSTNIKSTIKALQSFEKNVILILGGLNKGSDFSDLNPYLDSVKRIYCYGQSGNDIANKLKKYIQIKYVEDFSECVKASIENAVKNDNLLLSPGCASFDQFDNFEHRGDVFKKLIMENNNV